VRVITRLKSFFVQKKGYQKKPPLNLPIQNPDKMLFSISGIELEKLREWMATLKPMYSGAIGGRYTYSFCPTGIGTIVKVTYGGTGEVIDLTAYHEW